MKLRRKPEAPIGRHRASTDESQQSAQQSYSYSSRRSEEAYNVGRGDQAERAKQKLAKTANSGMRKFGLIILLLAIVVSAVKVLSLSSSADVKFVGSNSNNALTDKNGIGLYAAAAKQYLSGSLWNKNKLTVDSSGLVSYLTNKYPELASVSVSVPFVDNHLVVYITPTQPAITLVEPGGTYALDSSGRAILTAPSAGALGLNLPIVTDQSGLKVRLGKKAMTSDNVYFIEEVAGQLSAKGYKISGMTLPASTDELDAAIAGQPYSVKFNLYDNDPRQQAGTFLAVIANLKSQNITPGKYIDVRVDGRAYYQ